MKHYLLNLRKMKLVKLRFIHMNYAFFLLIENKQINEDLGNIHNTVTFRGRNLKLISLQFSTMSP